MRKFVNEIYQGLYFYWLKHRSVEEAKSGIKTAMPVTFFFWYFALLFLFVGIRVKLYGPFRPDPVQTFVGIFGTYAFLYVWLVHSLLRKDLLDEPKGDAEKQHLIKKVIWVMVGGIAFFVLTVLFVKFLYTN